MAAPQYSRSTSGFNVQGIPEAQRSPGMYAAPMAMPQPPSPAGVRGSPMSQRNVPDYANQHRVETRTPLGAAEPVSAFTARDARQFGPPSSDPEKVASIAYELKHDKIVSTEAILSSDREYSLGSVVVVFASDIRTSFLAANALAAFLKIQGRLRPGFAVKLSGTHTETRTRQVANADGKGTHTETYTVTITDFSFGINLTPLLTEEPIFYSLSDDTPAFRGDMRMAVEKGGPQPIEQRETVDLSVQSGHERAAKAALGRAPWLVSANPSPDLEIAYGSTPHASSRTFEQWLEDYCRSKRVVKEFIFNKEIFTWDRKYLKRCLKTLISSTGYRGKIHVKFSTSPEKVQVYSPNIVSKIFSSYLLIFLTSIILVFPFLWAWRRWWPDAGGKWETCGVAFRIKSWELVPGTGPGETIESAQSRFNCGLMGRRLRVGREGVFVMKGVHEADWFRDWELAIRIGVNNRRMTGWLDKITLQTQAVAAGAIAGNLDRSRACSPSIS